MKSLTVGRITAPRASCVGTRTNTRLRTVRAGCFPNGTIVRLAIQFADPIFTERHAVISLLRWPSHSNVTLSLPWERGSLCVRERALPGFASERPR